MQGVLNKNSGLSLIDMVQMLCANSSTACLILENSESQPGLVNINISGGKILNVVAEDLDDGSAMVQAIQTGDWAFELTPELGYDEDRIDQSYSEFLMNCVLQADIQGDATEETESQASTQRLVYEDQKTGVIPNTFAPDMVMMPHNAQVMGEAMGLGKFRRVIFQEAHSLVVIGLKKDKVVRRSFENVGLAHLETLREKLIREHG